LPGGVRLRVGGLVGVGVGLVSGNVSAWSALIRVHIGPVF